jgi:hypothetical protein
MVKGSPPASEECKDAVVTSSKCLKHNFSQMPEENIWRAIVVVVTVLCSSWVAGKPQNHKSIDP